MSCLALYTILFFSGISLVYPAPVVTTNWGTMSGIDLTAPGTGETVYAYLGIAYALPPLGERRFARPEPNPGLGDGQVFDASTPAAPCPQPDENLAQVMNEDCLTLNVYVPAAPSANGQLRDVMVFIHGGGYYAGSALGYTPGNFVTRGDVIVVVIQYRLGILGFLSSGDDVAPGNWGLWDQNLALRWVKDNIRPFGGDPNKLTIFGQSAGASSVGLQHLSPYSKGLFPRAIMQSGSPTAPWSINEDPRTAFYRLANETQCARPEELIPPQNVQFYARLNPGYPEIWRRQLHERIVECLKGISSDQLVPFSTFYDDLVDTISSSGTPWVPVVDGDFVPRDPNELIRDPEYLVNVGAARRDLLQGVNNNEGVLATELLDYYRQQFFPNEQITNEEIVNDFLMSQISSYFGGTETMTSGYFGGTENIDEMTLRSLVETLSFFYTQPTVNGEVSDQSVANLLTDFDFVVPMVNFSQGLAESKATLQQTNPGTAVGQNYVYNFDHFPQTDSPLGGMDHGAELAYLFDPNGFFTQDQFTSEDFALVDTFISTLTEFAKSGDPNNAIGGQLGGATWPEFSAAGESYLALAPQPRVETDLNAQRTALWLELLPNLVTYSMQTRDALAESTGSAAFDPLTQSSGSGQSGSGTQTSGSGQSGSGTQISGSGQSGSGTQVSGSGQSGSGVQTSGSSQSGSVILTSGTGQGGATGSLQSTPITQYSGSLQYVGQNYPYAQYTGTGQYSGSLQSNPATQYSGSLQNNPATQYSGSLQSNPSTQYSGSLQNNPGTQYSGSLQNNPATQYSGSLQSNPATQYSGSLQNNPATQYSGSLQYSGSGQRYPITQYSGSYQRDPLSRSAWSFQPKGALNLNFDSLYNRMSSWRLPIPR